MMLAAVYLSPHTSIELKKSVVNYFNTRLPSPAFPNPTDSEVQGLIYVGLLQNDLGRNRPSPPHLWSLGVQEPANRSYTDADTASQSLSAESRQSHVR